ncbi:MAG: glycosyltransferase family 39 protein [Phycisphaerae bacterium]|nr:glycosyltransferase family 39 protein [Phycisphaerae bacterium]
MTWSARRLPFFLSGPATLVTLAILMHCVGRAAAFCSPVKVDSFVYTVAAYQLYAPGATVACLIPDKPPGQAMLSGWVFHVWPGPPSRVKLLPVESAFLIAGYVAFWLLASRLFGRQTAAAMTLFFVVAQNTYNACDITTDGFNLGENYLVLPVLAAVYAHLVIERPLKRGLLRGLAIGAALAVKQTAATLLVAFVIHDLLTALIAGRPRRNALAGLGTLAGMALVALPLVGFLHAQGWLETHLHDLGRFSGKHLTVMPFECPPWYNISPLLPCLWWLLLGAAAWCCRPRPVDPPQHRSGDWSVTAFVWLWLAIEATSVWAMTKPSTHYYQQLVAPVALAAGLALVGVTRRFADLTRRDRLRLWIWVGATTAGFAIVAALPLAAEASKRVHTFDPKNEVVEFDHWVKTWSPSTAADHLIKDEH